MSVKYPCLTCKRVADPDKCENKSCGAWKRWFLYHWGRIHAYGEAMVKKNELETGSN
jgi:hypothetical protein